MGTYITAFKTIGYRYEKTLYQMELFIRIETSNRKYRNVTLRVEQYHKITLEGVF